MLNNSFFSVRNSLFMVIGLLTAFLLIVLTANIIEANGRSEQAQSASELNDLVDSITTLTLAANTERLAVATAYGFAERAPGTFADAIRQNRDIVNDSWGDITDRITMLDSFQANDSIDKSLVTEALAAAETSFQTYLAAGDVILADIASEKEIAPDPEDMFAEPEPLREYSSRHTIQLYDEFISNVVILRAALENSLMPDNAKLAAAARLKFLLWNIINHSGREAASIGAAIAADEDISITLQILLAEDSGQIKSNWATIQKLLSSQLIANEISEGEEAISEKFFNAYVEQKLRLYDADITNGGTYHLSAEQWLVETQSASTPVTAMNKVAGEYAVSLNKEVVDQASRDVWTAIILLMALMSFTIAVFWFIKTRVINSVQGITKTMTVLASGNLEVDVPYNDRVDEIGEMASAVQIFKENAIERIRLQAEQAQTEERQREEKLQEEKRQQDKEAADRAAQEEREEKEQSERRAQMLELADQFEAKVLTVVNKVGTSAENMEHAAQGMSATAAETTDRANFVSQSATSANSNAQMVAAATEELSASVREITGQTNQSSESARGAVHKTEQAAHDISALAEAAQKIGTVINLINDIAEQTNLLALNATIEAARAGEAGRGFAVVASEVKNLAEQTANATQEISDQVGGMQSATSKAVNAIGEINNLISGIESTAVSIASAVEEQDASTQEIARNVGEVSNGVGEVSGTIEQVREGAKSTGEGAAEVLDAAQSLSTIASDLRSQVESFLSTIRDNNS